jgi:hypothetical protein
MYMQIALNAGDVPRSCRLPSMEHWLPVLACACDPGVRSGDIYVTGRNLLPSTFKTDAGLPQKMTLEACGAVFDADLKRMVWQLSTEALGELLGR